MNWIRTFIMRHAIGLRRFLVLSIAGIILAVAWSQMHLINRMGNSLSPVVDAFSEANAIRAGESYAAEGFTRHAGLPNVAYGNGYAGEGFKGICLRRISLFFLQSNLVKNAYNGCDLIVYTHYPPGPDYVLGVMTKILGPGKTQLYRFLPLCLGILCLVFFAWALWNVFGPVRATFVMGALISVPMFTNMLHGLHYRGYAFSLLLAQLALYLIHFDRPHKGVWFGLGILGFFQGWLSFDYFFLVSFSAIPLWLIAKKPRSIRKLALAMVIPAAGFCLAHILHLIQLGILFGGFSEAITELVTTGAHRSHGGMETTPRTFMENLFYYLTGGSESRIIRYGYWPLMAIALMIGFFGRIGGAEKSYSFALGHRHVSLDFIKLPGLLSALGASIILSFLWLMVMTHHSIIHSVFRHFFLSYFVALVVILLSFRIRIKGLIP